MKNKLVIIKGKIIAPQTSPVKEAAGTPVAN